MNLYHNEVVHIDFEENILWVSWQERASLNDFKPIADTIAACSNQVKARYMLIDASTTVFQKQTPDKAIMDYFVQVTSGTSIKKIARLMSENASFESKVLFQKLNYEAALNLSFNYQFLTDKAEALTWLKANDTLL